MGRKLTTEEFIEKAKLAHGDKYDYSKSEYLDCTKKICIICPIHGGQWQNPSSHIQGSGCKECGRVNTTKASLKSFEDFLCKARKLHNDYYDYSKTQYKTRKDKAIIICPIHGEFKQTINDHLSGKGCRKCGTIKSTQKRVLSLDDFINKANIIHDSFYDYSDVDYKTAKIKVKIKCTKHGTFEQTPDDHLQGKGCAKCGIEKASEFHRKEIDDFISDSKLKFGSKFEYNKINYTNCKTAVCLICKIHGEFYQTIHTHLKSEYGCPACALESRSGENHYLWNSELTDEIREIKRDMIENDNWRDDVLKRDDYTCQVCTERGGKLNAHHLNGYHWCEEGRFDIDNGITLCDNCHKDFHSIYGNKYNTKEQFEEFMQLEFDIEEELCYDEVN